MPTPVQYPLINGVRHSFSSIEVSLGGQIFTGFKTINYSRTRSRTMVYGNSPDPIGKTRGKNEYKADCELYLAEWNLFQTLVGPGYGDSPLIIVVNYTEIGLDTVTDVLVGCTIDSTDASNSEGTEASVRKFELNPIKIIFGGLDDMRVPLVGVGI